MRHVVVVDATDCLEGVHSNKNLTDIGLSHVQKCVVGVCVSVCVYVCEYVCV